MAIDTAAKRYSIINFGEGDQMIFEVDGAVNADDRAHLLGLYGGNALAGQVGYAAAADSPVAIGRALWQRPCLWWIVLTVLGWC